MKYGFLFFSVLLASCGRNDGSRFILQQARIAHVGNCHVKLLNSAFDQAPPFVGLKYVCNASEADLDGWPKGDPRWSTNPTPPLGFTLSVGECMQLEKTRYCVETIGAGEVAFQAR